MTDLEFEKMIEEEKIWESRALVLYMDNTVVKPESMPYLTCAYLTNENYKYFNKVILEEYIFIFIVCKNSDDMKFLSKVYKLAVQSIFVIPIVLMDNSNIDYLHNKLFNSSILISQVQYEENSLILSDSIKSIWGSMFHYLTTKDMDNYVSTEYEDVKYIINTKGITLSQCITQNSQTAMQNNVKELLNSISFPKNVKNILLTIQISPNYSILKLFDIVEIFYDFNLEFEVVWAVETNKDFEVDTIKLQYFLCGLDSIA